VERAHISAGGQDEAAGSPKQPVFSQAQGCFEPQLLLGACSARVLRPVHKRKIHFLKEKAIWYVPIGGVRVRRAPCSVRAALCLKWVRLCLAQSCDQLRSLQVTRVTAGPPKILIWRASSSSVEGFSGLRGKFLWGMYVHVCTAVQL
jgi:hypothetical protein